MIVQRRKQINGVDQQIGRRIRAQRKALGLTQTKLGEVCGGISFQQIQKYEKGTNGVRGSRMQMIATALKVTPQFFFGGGEQHQVESDTLLTEDGAIDLLRAYSKLSLDKRKALRNLVEEMAE